MEIQVTIDTLGGVSGGDNCVGQTQEVYNPLGFGSPIYDPNGTVSYNTTMTLPCQDKCSWLYDLSDEHYEGIYGKESAKNIDYQPINTNSEINMNLIVKNDILDCNVFSNFRSNNCIISIYNLLGQLIENRYYNLSKGMNNYRINTDNYNSGLYLIQLSVDGMMKSADKFIIVK